MHNYRVLSHIRNASKVEVVLLVDGVRVERYVFDKRMSDKQIKQAIDEIIFADGHRVEKFEQKRPANAAEEPKAESKPEPAPSIPTAPAKLTRKEMLAALEKAGIKPKSDNFNCVRAAYERLMKGKNK